MQRVVDGDPAAFGELVARHRTSALRVATVVLGHVEGADDVVQEADTRAWRARATLDAGRPFRSWYLRVVANAARNTRRSRGRRSALELRDARASVATDMADPAELIVSEEALRAVLVGLNRLRSQERLVIGLRYFEQLNEREMSEVLGCAPGTVKSRLSRALGQLRDELRRNGQDLR